MWVVHRPVHSIEHGRIKGKPKPRNYSRSGRYTCVSIMRSLLLSFRNNKSHILYFKYFFSILKIFSYFENNFNTSAMNYSSILVQNPAFRWQNIFFHSLLKINLKILYFSYEICLFIIHTFVLTFPKPLFYFKAFLQTFTSLFKLTFSFTNNASRFASQSMAAYLSLTHLN